MIKARNGGCQFLLGISDFGPGWGLPGYPFADRSQEEFCGKIWRLFRAFEGSKTEIKNIINNIFISIRYETFLRTINIWLNLPKKCCR
jgi:hypothetical protein